MSVESRVQESLERAWSAHESGGTVAHSAPDEVVSAVDQVLRFGDAPPRQMLLTILAGTAENPSSNPASLQLTAGVDRRSQAHPATRALTDFKDAKGLTLKVSQTPGVSNPFREVEIDAGWVARRRGKHSYWAAGMFTIVQWLAGAPSEDERRERATSALDLMTEGIVRVAIGSALDYPRFRATPRLAMRLIHEFIDSAPDRPDATEAVVTVAARVLAAVLESKPSVERRDINSPDPIDVVIKTDDGEVNSGIEVTENPITLAKIQHEVVPAMLSLGLDRATVVSRGVLDAEKDAIDDYVARAYTHFEQRIDLVTVDIIESWLSFPGTPRSLATDFLWGVGDELDALSNNGNRRAWFDVLTAYAASISSP